MPETWNTGNQDPEILKPVMTNFFKPVGKTRKTFFLVVE